MAQGYRYSITLVQEKPGAASEEIESAFEDIGERVNSIDLDAWLSNRTQERCALLLDGLRDRETGTRIHDRLVCRRSPVLGIFLGQDALLPHIAHLCTDFLVWPCPRKELETRISNMWSISESPCHEDYQEELELRGMLDTRMVGRSGVFQRMQRDLRKIAACDAHALIEGETGTGKELAAHAIHYLSSRKHRPFIPVNCGALPDNLFENELFGHEGGAYTDASRAQNGLVRQAEGGTLFLDEVDSLTPRAQVILLRFLQDLHYRPLGSEKTRVADVRIVTASNRSLSELVSSGEYRQDLYFRLNIMHLRIPPLRDRPDDIERLAEHFVACLRARYDQPQKYLPRTTVEWLRSQQWPGNARELENLLTREFLMAEGPEVTLEHVIAPISDRPYPGCTGTPTDFSTARSHAMEAFETSYLRSILRRAEGNVSKAARLAGKERRAFGKLMKKHGIDRTEFFPL